MLWAILLSLLAGIAASYSGLLPASLESIFNDMPFYCLCVMLVLVGYGIGKDKDALRVVLKQNVKTLLIPLGTVVGTLIGGAAAVCFLDLNIKESLAVAAGLGWYSFSAVYLTEVHSADLGAISFLSNVFRELFALFLIPVVAKFMGANPAISLGGATTMDVSLPVITRYAGSAAAVTAFIHGLVISIIIPFLLPLIIH